MVFLLGVFGRFDANVLRTSEVLRWPGMGREGGARREDAASEGGDEGSDSGVSQNM
jgi:hypothetical protein